MPEEHSVVVKQPLSFGPAWELVKLGAKICRMGWNRPNVYVYAYRFPNDEKLGSITVMVSDEFRQHGWVPSVQDLFANDWYLWPVRTPEDKT